MDESTNMIRPSLLAGAIVLGTSLALLHLAAAQSPTCDSFQRPRDQAVCRDTEQRYRRPALQAPPQAEAVTPEPPVDPRVRDVLARLRAGARR